MVVEVTPLLGAVAQEFQLSEADLVCQSVRAFVERQLLQVNAQVLEIAGRYRVSSVAEMDARYQSGALLGALALDGTVYRHDNAPHRRWRSVSTFPAHFHDGSEDRVAESHLSPLPEDALRQFLSFMTEAALAP